VSGYIKLAGPAGNARVKTGYG